VSDTVIEQRWVTRPLIEVATLQRGHDLPVQDRVAGSYPIFAANGPVGFHDIAKCAGPGVVTGRSGTIGKVHFVEGAYWPLNTSLYVTDFHGNDPKWVYYMLRSFGLERFSQGAGVPTLNRNLVHGEPIRVPPLPEQRRIAAILDQADALRTQRREALAQLNSLTQSIFIEMFGDPSRCAPSFPSASLDALLSSPLQNGAYYPKEIYSNDGVEMVHMSDAFNGIVKRGTLKRVDCSDRDISKYGLSDSDILIASRSLTYDGAAKPCRVPTSPEPLIFESSFIRISPDPKKVSTA
jgi:type I restriction enzyme S subunit